MGTNMRKIQPYDKRKSNGIHQNACISYLQKELFISKYGGGSKFRSTVLTASTICDEGSLWCHYCGLLTKKIHKKTILRFTRLCPVNGSNLLLCESCKPPLSALLPILCIKLSKCVSELLGVINVENPLKKRLEAFFSFVSLINDLSKVTSIVELKGM